MKSLFLILIFAITLFGLSINESLLKIHAVLVPKIYLMDYAFKQKLQDNSITVALLYNQQSYKSAISLKNKINEKYKNGINDYNVKIKLFPYDDIAKIDANIYYIFPTTNKVIKKVIKKANSNHAITFSYLEEDLKHGVMLSLKVGSKVKPIINLSAAKSNKITFRPVLLEISKIYVDNNKKILNFNKQNFKNFNFRTSKLKKYTSIYDLK